MIKATNRCKGHGDVGRCSLDVHEGRCARVVDGHVVTWLDPERDHHPTTAAKRQRDRLRQRGYRARRREMQQHA